MKLIIFIFLACFICLANSFLLEKNSFLLEKICKDDVFNYWGRLVDSVIRTQARIEYKSEEYLLVNNITDDIKFGEEKVDLSAEVAKHNSRQIINFESSHIIFSEKYFIKMVKEIQKTKRFILKIKEKYTQKDENKERIREKVYDKIMKSLDENIRVAEELTLIGKNQLNEKYFSRNDLKNYLNQSYVKMQVKKFAFDNEDLGDYYIKQIVQYKNIKYLADSKGLIIIYEISVPVAKSKIPVYSKCLKTQDLPPFFDQKNN